MPLLRTPDAFALLRCVACEAGLESDGATCTNPACAHASVPYPLVAGQPVLIDAASSIVDPDTVTWTEPRPRSAAVKLLGVFDRPNLVAARVCGRLAEDLNARGGRHTLLVIGGGTIGDGLEALYEVPELDIVAFDIFPTACTQFVADAHRIPLRDGAVDAVVVQAVLEHVLDPWRVAAEIHRVLRPDGLVYADTPFLQPVHEGPYDFTRFTESGHRWLFRDFERIESGVVEGPGAQVADSLAQAARSVLPLRGVGPLVRFAATPLGRLIDILSAGRRPTVDGASAVYFYGRRADRPLPPREMIAHYKGAQRIPAQRPRPNGAGPTDS
jgi:SAM-dependent methyltransferase